MASNPKLNEFEASLDNKDKDKDKARIPRMRNRTKSADLSHMRKNDLGDQEHSLHYNSDHTNDQSNLEEGGYRSDTDENADELVAQDTKVEAKSTLRVLKRSVSGRFRRDSNKVLPDVPGPPPTDDTLHKLIRSGISLKKLKNIKKITHIDQIDSKGQSCLHLVSSRGQIDILRYLARKGANINLRDMNGFTPLHCAVIEKQLESCEALLMLKGIDLTATNSERSHPIHYLVRVPVTETNVVLYRSVLDLLLQGGVDVNICTRHGEAPIHFACMTNNIHAVAFLLERGANCNIATLIGETPLHYAIRVGNIKLVRVLMENGADPTIKGGDGHTPVDVAEQYQATEILDCLQSIIEEELETRANSMALSRIRNNENTLTRAGWLMLHRGEDAWERCWTVIDNQSVFCYTDQSKSKVVLDVALAEAEISKAENSTLVGEDSLWCFTVIERNKTSASFATTSPEEREGWIDILQSIVRMRIKLSSVYEKLKTLSKPRKRLRARERNLAFHNSQEGVHMLLAAVKSQQKEELLRLATNELSAAALSEVINPDNEVVVRNLVKILLHHGKLGNFLKAAISHDIRKTTVGETLFREMSLATRMLSLYLEMDEGREYLKSTVLDIVTTIMSVDHSLEVNPNLVGQNDKTDVGNNLEKIVEMAQNFLDQVLSSASRCPLLFRELMLHTRTRVDSVFPNMTHAVVGGFVFLRFLCPAIVTPHKFGLLARTPDQKTLRVCVLITKLLQSVSNGVEFDGSKEDYMQQFNPFIKKNRLYVDVFFDNLTNIDTSKSAMHTSRPLPKEELQQAETSLFEYTVSLKEKMTGLLTFSSTTPRPSHNDDSEDENSAVEADDVCEN